jgi:hypothetical protein
MECAICGGKITIFDRIIFNYSRSFGGLDCHDYWCKEDKDEVNLNTHKQYKGWLKKGDENVSNKR